jgi:hypothetical protein
MNSACTPTLFQFETDFVESLRCIPMQVRFNLDTCGVKLKLSHWNQFSQPERQALVDAPCTTAAEVKDYGELVQRLVIQHSGTPASTLPIDPIPAWEAAIVPLETQEKAQELGIVLTDKQWLTLTPLQRFVLIKLSRPSHENKNFLPALQEFRLA